MDSPASPATGSRRTADVDGHPTASSADDFTVHGKITYDNGNRYEGELKGGKRHGRGKMTFASGSVYDGDWVDDEGHGRGKMTCASGAVYDGEWVGGKRRGQGKMTLASGSVYDGGWMGDKRHGQGKYTWANGRVYEGLWEDDMMHGRGKHTSVNGDVYEGGWEDGKIRGQGKMTYANGDVYEGGWEEGKKHGQGTMTYANGRVHEGKWKKGKQPDIERRVEELERYCNLKSNELRLEELQEKIQGIPPLAPRLRDSYFFHGACEHPGVTLEIVECLLDAFPDAARSMDRKGRSPLHRACSNENIDPRIVRLILDSWPEAVDHQDIDGNVPLHWLCGSSSVDGTASLAILNLLLVAAPLSATLADICDALPIHVATVTGKSHPFCKRLIDAYPASLRVPMRRGFLPIHLACGEGTVETVMYMLELYPESIDARDLGGDLTIHWAAHSEGRDNPDIVKYLLAKDPDCASKSGNGERLPLHRACQYKRLESVRLLFDAYPEAIDIRDGDGRTPFDIARQEPDGGALVEFLEAQLAYVRLAEDTKAMTTLDGIGWLPLHRALRNNASLGAIKLLVAGNPCALRVAVNQLAFPLHIACEFSSVDVVQHIAGLSGILLHTLDLERNSPLHYACRGGNHGAVQCLVERGIPSVSEPDYNGKLPIQLLWESGQVDRNSVEYVDAVWRLLLARPETVMHWSEAASS